MEQSRVADIILQWAAATGVNMSVLDPNRTRWMNREIWDRDTLNNLQKSLNFDASGITTIMLVRSLYEKHLKDLSFSAADMVANPVQFMETLRPLSALKAALDHPEITSCIQDFKDTLQKAAEFYNAPPMPDLLADESLLAEIRFDALRGVEMLECHQFVKGTGEARPLGFNPKIYEFWNINSLLGAMRSAPSGITLCLIRDPDTLTSFFVFAIKNGQNIIFLTDRAKVPHPDFKNMSRSRAKERAFMERAGQLWLPYDLLDIKVDEERKALYTNARTALVPIDAHGVPLRDFKDLHPTQIIWLALMFDLINQKFWKEGAVAPQLSYTGEMIVNPHALVGEHGALVKHGQYEPLFLNPLTRDNMKDMHNDPQWQNKPVGFNHWMVERYEENVPESTFSVVGDLTQAQITDTMRKDGHLPAASTSFLYRAETDAHTALKTVDLTAFGTADSLDTDRRWTARRNQMQVIQHLANQEFDAKKLEILKWFQKKVLARREYILNAVASGEVLLAVLKDRFDFSSEPLERETRNALRQTLKENGCFRYGRMNSDNLPNITFGNYSRTHMRWMCADREDVVATVFSYIPIRDGQDAATILDIPFEELPWPLQHYTSRDVHMPYYGNPILNRLDPEDWALKNPWSRLSFDIRITQSKNAIHARRKALKLPRKVWSEDAGQEK